MTRNTVESNQVDQRVCPFLLRRRVEGAVVDEERGLLLLLARPQPQWGQLALVSCEKEPDLHEATSARLRPKSRRAEHAAIREVSVEVWTGLPRDCAPHDAIEIPSILSQHSCSAVMILYDYRGVTSYDDLYILACGSMLMLIRRSDLDHLVLTLVCHYVLGHHTHC